MSKKSHVEVQFGVGVGLLGLTSSGGRLKMEKRKLTGILYAHLENMWLRFHCGIVSSFITLEGLQLFMKMLVNNPELENYKGLRHSKKIKVSSRAINPSLK